MKFEQAPNIEDHSRPDFSKEHIKLPPLSEEQIATLSDKLLMSRWNTVCDVLNNLDHDLVLTQEEKDALGHQETGKEHRLLWAELGKRGLADEVRNSNPLNL